MKVMTLCLVTQGDKILLGMKKRGLGEGKWNGFGGKVDKNESIEEAAIRELKEECGIVANKVEKRAILNFIFPYETNAAGQGHIFHVTDFSGKIIESEEMKPQWFLISEIPYNQMWVDDIHWLPLFLEGKKFRADLFFKDESNFERKEISFVKNL